MNDSKDMKNPRSEARSGLSRKISSVNWNQVYYFQLVASLGSIKQASEVVGLSPSTVSEHIATLEEQLQVKLFDRNGRKLDLTEQGQKLHWHAKSMFENGERLLETVSPVHVGTYPVGIGIVPGAQMAIAYKWAGDFIERFGPRDVHLRHTTMDEIAVEILTGKIDFGFANSALKNSNLESRLISSSQVRFYVAEESSFSSLAPTLAKLPLLICRSDSFSDALLEKALQESDLFPSSVVTSDYPSVLLDLCRRGLGVGAFSEEVIKKLTGEGLKSLRLPPELPKIESNTYLIWPKDAASSLAVQQLKQLIK